MVFYNSRTLFDDTSFDFANGYSYKRRRGMDTYYLKKNHFQKESSPPVPDDVNDDVNDERPAVGLVGGKDQKVSLSLFLFLSLSR